MTDDAFLTALARDWQGAAADPAALARRYANNRAWARRTTAAGLLAMGTILACCLWLAWVAVRHHDALVAATALAFAAALPVAALNLGQARRQLLIRYDESPIGVLRQSRARATASDSLRSSARWVAGLIGACIAALWIATAAGDASLARAAPLSAIWGATAIGTWLWQRRRGAALADEIARCDSLIAAFDAA